MIFILFSVIKQKLFDNDYFQPVVLSMVKYGIKNQAKHCGQCLPALFISVASRPSHSQLCSSPLICLSLPTPPTSSAEEK